MSIKASMNSKMSRRAFVGKSAKAIGGAAALSMFPTLSQAQDITISWWDHFLPLQPLLENVFSKFESGNANVKVKHSVYSPNDLTKSLQLANSSGKLPDILAYAFEFPSSVLHKAGWFSPLEPYIDDAWKKKFPAGIFSEGNTVFGGDVYSFPIFNFRWHNALVWYNKTQLGEAGYDSLKTWDDFRNAAKKITSQGAGKYFGYVQGVGHLGRNKATLVQLAQTAGADGEFDWSTGEYAFASEPFVNALEFLVSLHKDGSLFPGGMTIDTRNIRARWAAGQGCLFLDGPWNIGVCAKNFQEFIPEVGVMQAPMMEASSPKFIGRSPKTGDFWISKNSKHPEIAANLLKGFVDESFQIGLAERMDQPPLFMDVVQKSNVHSTYKECMQFFYDMVRLSPDPVIKNPVVSEVYAKMGDIRPHHGEIVQGAISGVIGNVKKELQSYQDKMNRARDKAIKSVARSGKKVSLEDWVFPDYKADKDYTNYG